MNWVGVGVGVGLEPVDPLTLTMEELRERARLVVALETLLGPQPQPGGELYRCCLCRRVLVKGWSDAEAQAEFERRFPGEVYDGQCLFCDDCNRIVSAAEGMEL